MIYCVYYAWAAARATASCTSRRLLHVWRQAHGRLYTGKMLRSLLANREFPSIFYSFSDLFWCVTRFLKALTTLTFSNVPLLSLLFYLRCINITSKSTIYSTSSPAISLYICNHIILRRKMRPSDYTSCTMLLNTRLAWFPIFMQCLCSLHKTYQYVYQLIVFVSSTCRYFPAKFEFSGEKQCRYLGNAKSAPGAHEKAGNNSSSTTWKPCINGTYRKTTLQPIPE